MNQRSRPDGRGPQGEGPSSSPRADNPTPPPLNRRRTAQQPVPPPLGAGRGWARELAPDAESAAPRAADAGGRDSAQPGAQRAAPPFPTDPSGPRGMRAGQREADVASELAFTRGDLVRARSESEALRQDLERLKQTASEAERHWNAEVRQAREQAEQAREQFRSQEQAHAEAPVWQERAETLQDQNERLNAELEALRQQAQELESARAEAAQARDELEVARGALATAKDDFVRANAEMENIRRRAQEDVSKAHKFGIEAFAESLLPVADSLEMALKVDTPSIETLREGVEATLRQLQQAFDKNRLKQIAPEGQKFDPNQHQAISMAPAPGVPANHVVGVLQKGYLINDRVLRPALVTVSQGG